MKAKYVISALVLPLMIGACTNEEFITDNGNQTLDGNKIKLSKNFTLVGKKAEGASTRSAMLPWGGSNVLAWVPAAADATEILDNSKWDQIGLAWLNETPGDKVYTNYRFQHYGWLNVDETAVKLDKCNENKILNGVYFTGETTQTDQFKKWDGTSETQVGDFYSGGYNFTESEFTAANVNPANGLFKTDNSTIFSGNYIVYYPFNSDLKDIGYLTAKSKKEFANKNTAAATEGVSYSGDYMSLLAPELFMCGRTSITGGMQASDFNMGTVSGMIAVKVLNTSGASVPNISSVVLYAQGNGFITSAQLDASKIVSRESAQLGSELYVAGADQEISNTLISTASAAVTLSNNEYAVFGFAALPATATKVVAVIQDNTGKTFATQVSDITVAPNKWSSIIVDVNAALSDKTLYAYDQTSLTNAITLAGSATLDAPATINVLGKVEVTTSTIIPDYTTITGAAEGDMLVVANNKAVGVTLSTTDPTSIIDCDVEVQGVGCCGYNPGKLVMNGTLNANKTISNYGSIEFGDGSSVLNPVVKGTIKNLIDPNDEGDTPSTITVKKMTKVDLYGEISIAALTQLSVATAGSGSTGEDGTLDIYSTGKLVNNGDVTIEGNVGTQGVFENNATVTEKVSAQITGKGVTAQAENAQYICEVNSDVRYKAAINNNPITGIRPTTLVRFVDKNTAANQTYVLEPNSGDAIKNVKGNIINFESKLSAGYKLTLNGKAKTSPASEDIETTIGNLTLTGGGLDIAHKALTVNNLGVNHPTSAATADVVITENVTINGNMNILNFNGTANGIKIAKGVNVKGNVVVTNTNNQNVIFADGTTSTIDGNATVLADGKMKFEKNSVSTIKGTNGFTNDGVVDITPQTAVSGGDVAALVICRSFTNFGDKTKWVNGSYPTVNPNI